MTEFNLKKKTTLGNCYLENHASSLPTWGLCPVWMMPPHWGILEGGQVQPPPDPHALGLTLTSFVEEG